MSAFLASQLSSFKYVAILQWNMLLLISRIKSDTKLFSKRLAVGQIWNIKKIGYILMSFDIVYLQTRERYVCEQTKCTLQCDTQT